MSDVPFAFGGLVRRPASVAVTPEMLEAFNGALTDDTEELPDIRTPDDPFDAGGRA